MVQDEIKLEYDIEIMELLQVLTGNQRVIKIVIDNGKTTIQIAVKHRRQDIKKGEHIVELWQPEHVHDISQRLADAIWIRVKYDALWQIIITWHYVYSPVLFF